MSGDDVKRQVTEALTKAPPDLYGPNNELVEIIASLAPCIVLTAEEQKVVRRGFAAADRWLIQDVPERLIREYRLAGSEMREALALLTPNQEAC